MDVRFIFLHMTGAVAVCQGEVKGPAPPGFSPYMQGMNNAPWQPTEW